MDKVGNYVLEVNRMDKLKVCVIFGGASSEHDVSRVSVKSPNLKVAMYVFVLFK